MRSRYIISQSDIRYRADEICYIKPATQGIQDTLTARYCLAKNIACRHVGPLIFYRGFTQAFLDGATKTTDQLLADVRAAVDEVSAGKRVVLVDGVGYRISNFKRLFIGSYVVQ